MTNKPPPFKGLHIRIPIRILIKGRGFINQGSGLGPLPCQSSDVCPPFLQQACARQIDATLRARSLNSMKVEEPNPLTPFPLKPNP